MKKIISLVILVIFISSCYVGKVIYMNVADMNDYKKFTNIVIENDENNIFKFHKSGDLLDIQRFLLPDTILKGAFNYRQLLEQTKTMGFIIIRNDTILYENYFGYPENVLLSSFSVSKAFICALVGIAIDEGYIKSIKEPITNYINYWKDERFQKITIEHLLLMRSGIKFKEQYNNPFADVSKYYLGNNLKRYIAKLKIKEEPGVNFDYISVNTLLLSLIIEKATGMPIEKYFQEKLWKPLQMEYDALMSVDSKKNKTVKAFCCLNAVLRDYAKLGRLFLNNGKWNDKQIISEEWVKSTTSKRPPKGVRLLYHNHWNITHEGDFWAEGILGQFIYVYPKKI